jgi:hypothetical protein
MADAATANGDLTGGARRLRGEGGRRGGPETEQMPVRRLRGITRGLRAIDQARSLFER